MLAHGKPVKARVHVCSHTPARSTLGPGIHREARVHRDSEAHRACACSPGAPAEAGEARGLGLCAVVGGQRVTDHRRELAQHPSDLHSRCACPCPLHTGLGTVGRPPRLSHLAEKEERAGDGLPCFLDFRPPP